MNLCWYKHSILALFTSSSKFFTSNKWTQITELCKLKKPAKGNYVHLKFLSRYVKGEGANIDIDFVALVGFPGPNLIPGPFGSVSGLMLIFVDFCCFLQFTLFINQMEIKHVVDCCIVSEFDFENSSNKFTLNS
jgi:hypothetical protein